MTAPAGSSAWHAEQAAAWASGYLSSTNWMPGEEGQRQVSIAQYDAAQAAAHAAAAFALKAVGR